MIFTLSDAAELKKRIADSFSTQIHFHDGCGGQYFTVDQPTDDLKKYITAYLSERNLKARFSENGDRFSVEDDR